MSRVRPVPPRVVRGVVVLALRRSARSRRAQARPPGHTRATATSVRALGWSSLGRRGAGPPKAMQGWTWWTLSAPLGVFGIPSSCTRRVVLVATRRTRCSHAASLLTPRCASVTTEPAAAPPHGREAVEHPCDRQMTFLDHLGSSWPSAEAQRVRQSSKSHMAGSRNRWLRAAWGASACDV